MSRMARRNEDRASAPDDDELIRRCVADRSPDAFESLMSRYQDRIYRLIVRSVRDGETAADLTQETFLKAWKGLPNFQGEAEFFTWLYRIARNVINSEFRRVAARPRIVASIDPGFEEGEGGAREPEALGSSPEAAAMSRERQERLLESLDGLGQEFREIILLRDVEGESYEDLAELLEIPLGTVRSRLHRARLELKARMGKLA